MGNVYWDAGVSNSACNHEVTLMCSRASSGITYSKLNLSHEDGHIAVIIRRMTATGSQTLC